MLARDQKKVRHPWWLICAWSAWWLVNIGVHVRNAFAGPFQCECRSLLCHLRCSPISTLSTYINLMTNYGPYGLFLQQEPELSGALYRCTTRTNLQANPTRSFRRRRVAINNVHVIIIKPAPLPYYCHEIRFD